MMHANALTGIPYVKGGADLLGANCWGIVLLAFNLIFEKPIQIYEGSVASGEELATIITSECNSRDWRRIEDQEIGAVVVMYNRSTKRPEHMGVMTVLGRVLHTCKHHGSVQTRLRVIKRLFSKVEFYRYVGDNSHHS